MAQEIYQLYVRLKKISPRIWRRILVSSDTSIADLHYYMQIIMGWEGIHLHQFKIRGKSYGIYHAGGMSFSDDPRRVYLKDFEFHLNEKFMYQYDFIANWEHEIRVEKLLSAEPKKLYPRCINGKRAGPPEDCGGTWGFMELTEEYSLPKIYSKLRAVLEKYQSGKASRNHFEQMIEDLEYWINREKVNKQRINKELREYLLTKDHEATI